MYNIYVHDARVATAPARCLHTEDALLVQEPRTILTALSATLTAMRDGSPEQLAMLRRQVPACTKGTVANTMLVSCSFQSARGTTQETGVNSQPHTHLAAEGMPACRWTCPTPPAHPRGLLQSSTARASSRRTCQNSGNQRAKRTLAGIRKKKERMKSAGNPPESR